MINLLDSFLDLDENNKVKLLYYAKKVINPLKIYLILILFFLIIIVIINVNLNKQLINYLKKDIINQL